jgi:hypothetical protein
MQRMHGTHVREQMFEYPAAVKLKACRCVQQACRHQQKLFPSKANITNRHVQQCFVLLLLSTICAMPSCNRHAQHALHTKLCI